MAAIEFTARIRTQDGKEEITVASKRVIPDFEDFESKGFSDAFDDLEAAILEARKEASEEAVSQYLRENSKKNCS
jgi:hypothetical protein